MEISKRLTLCAAWYATLLFGISIATPYAAAQQAGTMKSAPPAATVQQVSPAVTELPDSPGATRSATLSAALLMSQETSASKALGANIGSDSGIELKSVNGKNHG